MKIIKIQVGKARGLFIEIQMMIQRRIDVMPL